MAKSKETLKHYGWSVRVQQSCDSSKHGRMYWPEQWFVGYKLGPLLAKVKKEAERRSEKGTHATK